jgi:uncharacterized protein YjiS (DUF1127 family)
MTPTMMTLAPVPAHGGYWRTEHERAYRLGPRRPRPASSPGPMRRRGWMPAAGLLLRWVEVIEAWRSRARSRRALLEMSDAMLKDIGLGRADAWREGSKPFWET